MTSSNSTDLYNRVSFTINYTDERGTAGSFTSAASSIDAPSPTPTPTPSPAPTPAPSPSAYAVSISNSACTTVSRDNFRTYFSITATGSVTGPANNSGLVVSSNFLGGGLQEQVSCGSWTPAAADDFGVDCRRRAGNPATTTWSVTYPNHSVGHQQDNIGFEVGAHAKGGDGTNGNYGADAYVTLDCKR